MPLCVCMFVSLSCVSVCDHTRTSAEADLLLKHSSTTPSTCLCSGGLWEANQCMCEQSQTYTHTHTLSVSLSCTLPEIEGNEQADRVRTGDVGYGGASGPQTVL